MENDEKYYGICSKCCDVGRGNIEISSYVDILQGCTPSLNLLKVSINDMIEAVEGAK